MILPAGGPKKKKKFGKYPVMIMLVTVSVLKTYKNISVYHQMLVAIEDKLQLYYKYWKFIHFHLFETTMLVS